MTGEPGAWTVLHVVWQPLLKRVGDNLAQVRVNVFATRAGLKDAERFCWLFGHVEGMHALRRMQAAGSCATGPKMAWGSYWLN